MNRIGNFVAVALVAVLAACGGTTQSASTSMDAASDKLIARATAKTKPVNVQVVSVKGALIAKSKGTTPRDLVAGNTTTAESLTATGRGAIVDLGNGASLGRVWLRGGAQLIVGRDSDGGLHLVLRSGQARFEPANGNVKAFARSGGELIDARGRDIVLRSTGTDSAQRIEVAETEHQPALALWSLALEQGIDSEPVGIGTLQARIGGKAKAYLKLNKLSVSVETAGDLAITKVEHIFHNSSDQQLEGTFRFPMPEGAMLLGLSMEINGKLMHGELVEREKARKTYQSIVDEMQDPALLEWQQGRWFKLRIFPIEAKKNKRVVLRYASPLRRGVGGLEYVYATAAPAMQGALPAFNLSFNGKTITNSKSFKAGQDVVVPVKSASVPVAVREIRKDGTYTFARLQLPWKKLARKNRGAVKTGPRRMVIVFDTSRSAMESRKIALQTLTALLGQLDAKDTFAVIAADLEIRSHAATTVRATPAEIAKAIAFVKNIEPDGASDVGAALSKAGAMAKAAPGVVDIVYLGDGTPTWGKTTSTALGKLADDSLINARLHAALLGKGTSSDLWRGLVGRHGGRLSSPRTSLGAKQFAFFVSHSRRTARLDRLVVKGPKGAVLYPKGESTLFQGDAVGVVLKTTGKEPPKSLTIEARFQGKPVRYQVAIASAKNAKHVSKRWASQHMLTMTADGAKREDIVKLSLDHQVMSRHTSFLVLESEEAYKKFNIKRRNKLALAKKNNPTVTGGDLNNVAGNNASLSPNEFQPGDPEIRIPAPANARSVVVVFPFGDTKIAHYDAEQRVWLVRFLIDKSTMDGTYNVLVKITHADGRIQSIKLPYVVDTQAPKVDITVKRLRKNRYLFVVKQKPNAIEMTRVAPNWRNSSPQVQKRVATIASDVGRVEVLLPNGKILRLYHKAPGLFRKVWRLKRPLKDTAKLRFVVTDRALNQAKIEVNVEPEGSR